jgi:hypothetical protein
MQAFVRGDSLNVDHRVNLVMTADNKIVMVKMMIQMVPSVASGIRYVVFFKELQTERNLVCMTAKYDYQYFSSSMERMFDTAFSQFELKSKLVACQSELKANQKVSWNIMEKTLTLQLVTELQADKGNLMLFVVT